MGEDEKKLGVLTSLLATIAGADKDVLVRSPRADRSYINLIGFMLLLSGSVLFAIAFGSVIAAEIGASATEVIYLGVICAFIAMTVMMIDRAFIMADWFSYGSQKPEGSLRGPSTSQKFRRFGAIIIRIMLSVAIAFVFSTLAETYLYRDDLTKEIERRHLEANAPIFEKLEGFEKAKNEEIEAARANLQALEETFKTAAKQRQNAIEMPLAEIPIVAELVRQIDDANGQITQKRQARELSLDEAWKLRGYADEERYGDAGQSVTGKKLTGQAGCGPGSKCQRALDDADDAEQRAARLQTEILALEKERDTNVTALDAARAIALSGRKETLSERELALENARNDRDTERTRLETLEREFEATLANRADFLASQPGFIPRSNGLAARFQALHDVYGTYGILQETVALKLFIMMLEMAPFLIKVLASPRTYYAIELNRKIASMSYDSESDRLAKNADFLEKDYKAFQERRDWERRAREDDLADDVYNGARGAV